MPIMQEILFDAVNDRLSEQQPKTHVILSGA
jgi:hypothetical protein